MTKEQAQKRVEEWHIVAATTVWQDFIDGIGALERVHESVLRKSQDEKKIFKSQGALDVINVVAKARDNQIREAVEIMEGKRTTEQSARVR